ncbi:MAG TPA: serine hydrolase [Pyrinomonadaceae bacterium]|nr:serine hydrolase [Pyrinomonadaceae bacterium]
MPNSKKSSRLLLALLLNLLLIAVPLVPQVAAQQATQQANKTQATAAASAQNYTEALAAIETAIEARRKELGIPGLSLVIVKDDQIIYMKGLGLKDIDRKLPVTPDTLFAIGSASKAFTAMAAVMSADEGRLSLEDSPKKFLPYFTLRDADAAAKITLRDLLAHRSGLNRTDLAMVTNKLNREELIKVAGRAKPTNKLGEKFQYQNVMYAAAGEVVAQAQHSTWDAVMVNKIFKPLGMRASNTTAAAMQKARDYSLGYDYNASTKVTRQLPQREIPAAAPAGAINSSARDMAQWLRFMLAGGTFNGKRLVSEKGFNETITKQMNVAGTVDYGLGWFLRQWNGHKVVEHGGNIDGFNSQVAFMPDQKLGFVLMTNVTGSPLGGFAMNTVWKNLVGDPKADQKPTAPANDPKVEVGQYRLAEAPVTFEVTFKDGTLTLTVPGQPPYPLKNLGGRRYQLMDPAPAGFFATFRPVKDKESETELFIEQPQGDVVARKVVAGAAATTATPDADSLNYLVGSYQSETSANVVEISMQNGKVSLVVPGQTPYPLVASEKDKVRSPGLPETYWIEVKRDEKGDVSGIVLNQPEGRFTLRRLRPDSGNSLISIEELMAKTIEAYGGEANLRKHKSSLATVEVDLESQGLTGYGLIKAKAPNMAASEMTITALDKKIGSIVSYFDGNAGGELMSFAPDEVYSGKRLEDIKVGADFYDLLDWKKNYPTMVVKRIAKVGGEDAYVVEKRSEKGSPVTDYISVKTFFLLKRESVIHSDTTGVDIPQSETFSDYRNVDGVMVPFKSMSSNIANGDTVVRVKELKFDVDIPDTAFNKPAKPTVN